MRADLFAKSRALNEIVRGLGRVVIAYSGGVDSSFLASRAHEALGKGAWVLTAVSPSLSRRELEGATRLASERGWQHELVHTAEVERDEYARNSVDRCYWCKTELFELLEPIARAREATIAVGTNTDDLSDLRPGLRASREHSVRAPLVEAGLAKAEVRELARAAGLSVADKPASPCLASRFAYGVRVTQEGLERIEHAEEIVRALGFAVFRVRDHGDLARIEVPAQEIERAAGLRGEIETRLRALGWRYVTLDLSGFRSGSMNEVLPQPRINAF